MRYCTDCGKKVGEDMKFCPGCGHRLIPEERSPDVEAGETADVRAESVLAHVRDIAEGSMLKLLKARDDGYLPESENRALRFVAAGPYQFARCLLTDKKSPLYVSKTADAPSEDVAARAYAIIEFTLLHVLRELMHNSTEVAAAIGTQHAELLGKYCAIKGYSASDVELWLSYMDSDMVELEEHLVDPRPAWFRKFREFHETLTGQPVNTGGLSETMFYQSMWSELLVQWGQGLRERLGVKNRGQQ